jgi:glutathione S-transferase
MTTARPQTAELTIVIGDKNLSSWSLRPWLALHATGYPFRERKILLNREDTRAKLQAVSPTAKVPALIDGELVLWESLAICETLAEWFPAARLWPVDATARAHCRSVAAEMHGGFAALRQEMPMNLQLRTTKEPSAAVQADVDRITKVWRMCRERYARGGALLFGGFTLADCMYAPVVTRFRSYGVALDDVCQAYCEAVLALPAMQAWYADAAREVAAG